jgi:hypothetical protein
MQFLLFDRIVEVLTEAHFLYEVSRRDRMVVGFTTTYAISPYHH